jgi:hypothetical protein
MLNKWRMLLLLALTAQSCGDKYRVYERDYTFRTADGRPDYERLDYWAAHPEKKDPSDSIPGPLQREPVMDSVDIFFLHPTTYVKRSQRKKASANIDDPALNARTDYTSILYQASVFNAAGRVFAPRYRQAHLHQYFTKDTAGARQAFDTAYSDIRRAFDYYLVNRPAKRPLIIAGHSQGAMHALRLLKERVEGTPLAQYLVAAYIIGWPLPAGFSSTLPVCADSLQTGCLCSWRTFRRGYIPRYARHEKPAVATNPLSWDTTATRQPASRLLGSVLLRFDKIYPHTTDAQAERGLLFVRKPRFPWSFLFFRRNYHVADINLFYLNVRRNVSGRVKAWYKTKVDNP